MVFCSSSPHNRFCLFEIVLKAEIDLFAYSVCTTPTKVTSTHSKGTTTTASARKRCTCSSPASIGHVREEEPSSDWCQELCMEGGATCLSITTFWAGPGRASLAVGQSQASGTQSLRCALAGPRLLQCGAARRRLLGRAPPVPLSRCERLARREAAPSPAGRLPLSEPPGSRRMAAVAAAAREEAVRRPRSAAASGSGPSRRPGSDRVRTAT